MQAGLVTDTAGSRQPLPNFDRVARIYRWAEYLALGPLLKRTREHFLPELSATRQVLVLGDGDGRFTAALLRRAPALRVHAVDSSARMLQLLHARCVRDGTADRLSVQQASVLDAEVAPGCDLVATHFLLDCLPQAEAEALAITLAARVGPRCRWVISEFGIPAHAVGRLAAAAYIRLLYAVFRALTGLQVRHLPDVARALQAAGFVRSEREQRVGGLLYSELWELGPAPAPERTAQLRPGV